MKTKKNNRQIDGPVTEILFVTDSCEDRVIQKIRKRQLLGKSKYGKTMERDDLSESDWLTHAQEEAMDLAIYLEKMILSAKEFERLHNS